MKRQPTTAELAKLTEALATYIEADPRHVAPVTRTHRGGNLLLSWGYVLLLAIIMIVIAAHVAGK